MTRQLNGYRRALSHGWQAEADRDGTTIFRTSDGTEFDRLDFEQLLDAASNDLDISLVADQALRYAFLLALDDRGAFDDRWERVQEGLAALDVDDCG